MLKNAILCGLLIIASEYSLASFDQDNDGISDSTDNCTTISNPGQYDSNQDGIGNLCDADLNNDGVVDNFDYDLLFQFFSSHNLDADLNEDGRISNLDLSILNSKLGTLPGPYGIHNYQLYSRPRILTNDQVFAYLRNNLTKYPYTEFWDYIYNSATLISIETPPCPVDNPECGSEVNISSYTESSIRVFGEILPYLALAYRLTEDPRFLEGARTWMNALVSYEDWASNTDIGAAHLLIGMSIVYDWLYSSFTELELRAYREKMEHHANILANVMVSNNIWWAEDYYSNHNYTNASAIMFTAIALYGEASDADAWIDASNNNFSNVLQLLSPDGACMEGASYWARQMSQLLPYFLAIYRYEADIAVQALDNGYFRNAASFRLYSSLPDYSENVDFSDSDRYGWNNSPYVLRGLAMIFSDPRARWLAERLETANSNKGKQKSYHWLNMLWHTPNIPKSPPNDLPLYKYFDNLGILFSRSSWNEDAFWGFHKSAPYQGYHAESLDYYLGPHAHPDAGQFLAWSNGRWLIIEDGYVQLKRTDNHNVLTFNDTGQLGSDYNWFNGAEVRLHGGTVSPLHISLDAGAQYIVTELASMYRESADVSSWKRSFVALPEGYLVIRDDIQMNNPGHLTSYIHGDIIAEFVDNFGFLLNPHTRVPEAFDRSNNGNNGVITGSYVSHGKTGYALNFLGDTAHLLFGSVDRVFVPSLSYNAFPQSGSLSLWLKSGDSTVKNNLFDINDSSRDHIYIRTTSATSQNSLGVEVIFQSKGNDDHVFNHILDLTPDEWHHIVITWDTLNDWAQVFVDETLSHSSNITNSGWSPSEQFVSLGNGFRGMIDELHLYDRALTEHEVSSLFNLQKVDESLTGYWSFDGIDDELMPNFRSYSYRMITPINSTISDEFYVIPPEERDGSNGNYIGRLFSTTHSTEGSERIIHFVGDVYTPVVFDSQSNRLIISKDTYEIEIDFNNKSVTRSPVN